MKNGFQFFLNTFLGAEKSYSVTYEGNKRWLAIPSEFDGAPVTAIGKISGEEARKGGRARVTRVRIPESVTTISEMAFAQCTALKKIALPKSVIEIGSGAFPKDAIQKIFFADCAGWTVSYNGKTEDVPEETLRAPEKAANYYKSHLMWTWKKG